MKHNLVGRKFNRTKSQRASLLIGLVCDLVIHEQIVTTLAKAKDLRRYIEKMISMGRNNTLANRRLLLSRLKNNHPVVNKMLDILGPRYAARPGGYIRIIKNGVRAGDCAPMAIIEFVDRNMDARGQAVAAQALRPALI